jgi:hypothetical protein
MQARWTRFALSLVAVAIGCGGGGPSSTQACADLAQARCAKRASCTNNSGIVRSWGDMSTCLQREQLQCSLGLSAPSTGNTPAAVEQCVAAYAGFSCADFLNNNPPAACIANGPKQDNAPCAFGGQCASTYCVNNKTSVCGTCGAPPAMGASCESTSCARGQECDQRSLTCIVPGVAQSSCDNNTAPCGPDLACIGNVMGAMGTCMQAIATAGAPCGGMNGQCDGTMGLTCSGMAGAKTCVAVTYVGDGMPCGIVNGAFVGCSGGGACYTASGVALAGEMGMCKTAAADGAACDTVVGPPCLTPARCVTSAGVTSGTCTVPAGSTCG